MTYCQFRLSKGHGLRSAMSLCEEGYLNLKKSPSRVNNDNYIHGHLCADCANKSIDTQLASDGPREVGHLHAHDVSVEGG